MADVNRWGAPPVPDPNAIPLPGMLPPPMPPPATPASAGFAAWANDQQNAQKVANSLVKPGQPILPPNAQQAGQQAAQQPTQSPQEAPAMPPQNPGVPPPMQTTPVMGGGPPQIPNSPMPNVVNQDATPQSWAAAHPDQAAHSNWRHQEGSGWRGALKDVAGLATAGLIGGVGAAKGDPTAGLRWSQQQADYDRAVPDINQQRWRAATIQPQIDAANLRNTTAQTDQRLATAGKSDAQTDAIPVDQQRKQQQVETQKRIADAKIKNEAAQNELRAAQTEYERSKMDPHSVANRLALGRLQTAQTNAHTAQQNLGIRQAEYNMHAYGTDASGQRELPGVLHDEQGNSVGSVQAANVKPTTTERDAAGRADSMMDIQGRIEAGLKDPEILKYLGPIAGRAAEGAGHLGLLPEKVAAFKNDLVSYGAFQAGLHPVRGIGALEYFDKVMGGLGQDPEQLAGKLRSNADTAGAVQRVGEMPTNSGNWRKQNAPNGSRPPAGGQVIEYEKKADGTYGPKKKVGK